MEEMLLMLLGEGADENIAKFCLSDVYLLVMDYCNVATLSDRLKAVIVSMAADLYRSQQFGSTELPSGAVTSIKEGEQSVTYGGIDEKSKIFKDYRGRLNMHRKLR